MTEHDEMMWNYLKTYGGIGCKVKTPEGVGVVVDIDAGAAILVEPVDENEEWEDYKLTIDRIEPYEV